MRYYKEKTIRELYRLRNKYWKTGDVDILPAARIVAKEIDEKFYDEVKTLCDFAARKHMPVQTVIDALALFGYEVDVDANLKEGAEDEAD